MSILYQRGRDHPILPPGAASGSGPVVPVVPPHLERWVDPVVGSDTATGGPTDPFLTIAHAVAILGPIALADNAPG